MSSLLRKAEKCPIHHSYFCCGRETKRRSSVEERIAPGVFKIPDVHHPRGYRVRRTAAAKREMLKKKIVEQGGRCASVEMGGCGKPFEDMRYIELDHIEPKGMGSARADDHEDNLQALHKACNRNKGSIRLPKGEKEL